VKQPDKPRTTHGKNVSIYRAHPRALRAKFKLETDVFFMILLRKIMKNSNYLAGSCPEK
jgi:hypothetical protein